MVVSRRGKFSGVVDVAGRLGLLTRKTRLVLEDDVQGVDDAGNVWDEVLDTDR
jgi:hypothetical protein